MLNKIWFWLLLIGILYGFGKATFHTLTGQVAEDHAETTLDTGATLTDDGDASKARGLPQMGKDLNAAALDAAEVSVEICIGLIGIMALWLGMLRIAQDSGLVDALARALRPLMRWLFPDVPDGHPALGAMLMNISANMLCLENAATPLGLKAIRELQTLNPTDDTATDAMATFLAINTSNVTLVPITIIGYRLAAGSENPAGPLMGIILTTTVSSIVAVLAVRWLARWPRFKMSIPHVPVDESPAADVSPGKQ